VEAQLKDIYIEVCSDLNKRPIQRILNNITYDNGILRIDGTSVSDSTIVPVLIAVKRAQQVLANGTIFGLSFSHNVYFEDQCLLHLISFMERLKSGPNTLRSLYLERINVSHTILFKLCKSLSNFYGLAELSLAGNHLPYFCIDALVNSKKLPQGLKLSDTRMDDLSAFSLVSRIIRQEDNPREKSVR
jgi:hypothetical protein